MKNPKNLLFPTGVQPLFLFSDTEGSFVAKRIRKATPGAVMAFFGFIHSGETSVEGSLYSLGFGTGAKWATGYTLTALFFIIVSHMNRKRSADQRR